MSLKRNLQKKQQMRRNYSENGRAENHLVAEQRELLASHWQKKEYNAVLQTISRLFELGERTPDLMFMAAQIYYNTGDLERAAVWADSAYKMESSLANGLFLAKIYLEMNDVAQAAKVIDALLAKEELDMSAEEEALLQEMLFQIELAFDMDKIKDLYNNIYLYEEKKLAALDEKEMPYEEEAGEIWQADEREKAPEWEEREPDLAMEDDNVIDFEKQGDAAFSDNIPEQSFAAEDGEIDEILILTPENYRRNMAKIEDNKVEEIKAAIDGLKKSLREKIAIFNLAASYFFQKQNWQNTLYLLQAALKIDAYDSRTLRNLFILSAALGDEASKAQCRELLAEDDFSKFYMK